MMTVLGFSCEFLRRLSIVLCLHTKSKHPSNGTKKGNKRNERAKSMMKSSDKPKTTPPFTSDSISLKRPSSKTTQKSKTPSPTLTVQRFCSQQLDLTGVPEREFFLVGPTEANVTTEPLLLVRPCAHRANEAYSETPSFAAAATSSLFTSIDQDSDDDSDSEELTSFEINSSFLSASLDSIEQEVIEDLRRQKRHSPHTCGSNSLDDCSEPQERHSGRLPRIHLKHRPAALRDGQRSWESISRFSAI